MSTTRIALGVKTMAHCCIHQHPNSDGRLWCIECQLCNASLLWLDRIVVYAAALGARLAVRRTGLDYLLSASGKPPPECTIAWPAKHLASRVWRCLYWYDDCEEGA